METPGARSARQRKKQGGDVNTYQQKQSRGKEAAAGKAGAAPQGGAAGPGEPNGEHERIKTYNEFIRRKYTK